MHTLRKLVCTAVLVAGLLIPFSASSAQKDILILFSDGAGLSKSVGLWDYQEWATNTNLVPKRIDALLKEGWSLLQVVPVNAKQHYWIFVK